MPQRLQFDTLLSIWEELVMKFPTQIYQVTPNAETCTIIFKVREITKEIRDHLILRRFCSMAGVEVGFFKPRRLSPAQKRAPQKEQPVYKVWVTVHIDKNNYYQYFPVRIDAYNDISAEEFETWLTRAKRVQKLRTLPGLNDLYSSSNS